MENSSAQQEPTAPVVCVREIMEEVRRRVEEKRKANFYRDDRLSVEAKMWRPCRAEGPVSARLDLLASIGALDIQGTPITSHRPVLGRFVKPVKRFTRYWARKYTDSIFLQQNYFNAEAAETMRQLHAEIEELRAEVGALRQQLAQRDNGRKTQEE